MFPKHIHVAEKIVDVSPKTNSSKGERQICNDAEFWLPQLKPEHLTWLDHEAKKKVQLVKTLDDFWDLDKVHQDHDMADWFSIFRKGRSLEGPDFINDSLYQKAFCFQRAGRLH